MLNNVSLVGRLTKNPVINETNNGIAYAKFILAVQRNYIKNDGNVDVDFIPCISWGKNAENISNSLIKGSLISLEGNIATSNYQDSKGQNKFTINVNVNSFNYLENGSFNKKNKKSKKNNLKSNIPSRTFAPSKYQQETQDKLSKNIIKQPVIDDPNAINKAKSFDNIMSNQNIDFFNKRSYQDNFKNEKSNRNQNNISKNDNDNNDQYFSSQFNVSDGDIPF